MPLQIKVGNNHSTSFYSGIGLRKSSARLAFVLYVVSYSSQLTILVRQQSKRVDYSLLTPPLIFSLEDLPKRNDPPYPHRYQSVILIRQRTCVSSLLCDLSNVPFSKPPLPFPIVLRPNYWPPPSFQQMWLRRLHRLCMAMSVPRPYFSHLPLPISLIYHSTHKGTDGCPMERHPCI
jgi:hypothetical protein